MTAGGRRGGRLGGPAPHTLGRGKPLARALGQGPRVLARGQRANCPPQLGAAPAGLVHPWGGSAQVRVGGAACSPGRPAQVRVPSSGDTSC